MFCETIGIVASILILFSAIVKSTSVKGNLIMRGINICGSVLFCVYGYTLHAFSTVFLNFFIIIFHLYYIVKLIKELKNEN